MEALLQFQNNAVVFMTQEQGAELGAAGLIVADANQVSPTNPLAYLVSLTPAGAATLASMTAAPALAPEPPLLAPTPPVAPAPAPAFGLTTGIAVPAKPAGRSRQAQVTYPFDQMEIGDSFHLPVTETNSKPHLKIGVNVKAANKKNSVPTNPPSVKSVEKRRRQKDAAGNNMVDANNKRLFEKFMAEEPILVPTKLFICRKVDETDPAGVGARVFRVPLDFVD